MKWFNDVLNGVWWEGRGGEGPLAVPTNPAVQWKGQNIYN